MKEKFGISAEELGREIASRPASYYISTRHSLTSPVEAVIHINEVIVRPDFPAVIVFSDGENQVQLSQLISIERMGDGFKVTCGYSDDTREIACISLGKPDCIECAKLRMTA